MPVKVQFKEWPCVVKVERYTNGRICLRLIDENDGSPVAVATVNMPGVKLKKSMAIIKDYSENEGMFSALRKAKIIKSQVGEVRSGFVVCPIARLNMKLLEK